MATHAAACALVLAFGFTHVSDDDYARVTIAQAFAHGPRLDPSGTSWLPFPFWATGTLMFAFGRSMLVARIASIALASLAAALPYLALRWTGSRRSGALGAVAFAMLSPWPLWLGAATVPESMTASFTAAAMIALGAKAAVPSSVRPSDALDGAARTTWSMPIVFAFGLLAACLSRYEAWPVAAVLAIVLGVRARRGRGVALLVLGAVLALGPLAWIAWNAYAHGNALHFFERVSRFKRAFDETPPSTLEAVLLYPRLLVTTRPDVAIAVACAAVACKLTSTRAYALRSRWLIPLACAGGQIAFLAYGSVRDSAPTHHPERAVLGASLVLALFAGDVLVGAWPVATARARHLAIAGALVISAAWVVTSIANFRAPPGKRPDEDRSAQIQAGIQLRDEGVTHVVLTPCAFEHFALIAAYGAPERVESLPRKNVPVERSCPAVERR